MKASFDLNQTFPDWIQKDRLQLSGFDWIVLEKRHTATRAGEDDVFHNFSAELLLLPSGFSPSSQDSPANVVGYAIFAMQGYSSYSSRHDDFSKSVSVRLADGFRKELKSDSYYQKYGGRSTDEKAPAEEIARVTAYVCEVLGYADFDADRLFRIANAMEGKFSY